MTGNAAPCPGRCCHPMTQWSATLGLGAIADFLTHARLQFIGRFVVVVAGLSPAVVPMPPSVTCPSRRNAIDAKHTRKSRGNRNAATAAMPSAVFRWQSTRNIVRRIVVFRPWFRSLAASPRSRRAGKRPVPTGQSPLQIFCSRFALRFSEGLSFAHWAFSRAPIWDRPCPQ